MPDSDSQELFPLEVFCYSGYRYGERPISFKLRGKTFTVQEIIDQWYGEDHTCFKVRTENQKIYLLKYDPGQDQWSLTGPDS